MDNGPSYEPRDVDLPDELVYCVDCGSVYVWRQGRDCPACHLYEKIVSLNMSHDW
jgi:hypothetical protein